jgi:hypothetical protein
MFNILRRLLENKEPIQVIKEIEDTAKTLGYRSSKKTRDSITLSSSMSDTEIVYTVTGSKGNVKVTIDNMELFAYSYPDQRRLLDDARRVLKVYQDLKAGDYLFRNSMNSIEKNHGRRWKFGPRRVGSFYTLLRKKTTIEILFTPDSRFGRVDVYIMSPEENRNTAKMRFTSTAKDFEKELDKILKDEALY